MKIIGCRRNVVIDGVTKSFGLLIVFVVSAVQAELQLVPSVWKHTSDFNCLTSLTFLSDKEYVVESGEQIVTKSYKLSRHKNSDFFLFSQRIVANNEVRSCAGIKAARIGSRQKFYAKFNSDMTEMMIYPRPEEESVIKLLYLRSSPSALSSN